ncbi:UNVERIFIED_CONTAM: hypothetical protein BEN50_25055 [Euhalothece sp. KZN 001]
MIAWPIHMALRLRAERRPDHKGRALAILRRKILLEEIDGRVPAGPHMRAWDALDRLRGYRVEDMPPPVADLELLIDALAFRGGLTSRAAAWRSIGVPANTGKAYLAHRHSNLTWPVWFTLRETALGSENSRVPGLTLPCSWRGARRLKPLWRTWRREPGC